MSLLPVPELSSTYDDDSLIYKSDTEFYYGRKFQVSLLKDIQNKTMQIYTGYYVHKKGWKTPKIYLIGRGKESGKFKLKIQGFRPYCYIPFKEGDFVHFLGERVEKILFDGHPSKVKKFREARRYQCKSTYEADIIFVRRFLCDMYDYFKSNVPVKPRVAIFDVETNYPVSEDIISYAVNDTVNPIIYDSKYTTPYLYELALNLYNELLNYDIIVGWNTDFDVVRLEMMLEKIDRLLNFARKDNTLDKLSYIKKYLGKKRILSSDAEITAVINKLFDMDYLRESDGKVILGDKELIKIPTIKYKYVGGQCSILDLIPLTKKMYGKQIRGKWELGNTGRQLCGIDKLHTGAKHIKDLDADTLMQYNVMDTIVPEIIDNYLGGIEAHSTLCWSLQSKLEDVVITAIVSDISLLRKYHKEGVVLNSRDKKGKVTGKRVYKYEAAKPDARPGMYHDIVTTDIVHAYPFAVISNNISPETKDITGKHIIRYTNKKGENKVVRYNDNRSIFVELLKYSVEQRTPIKKMLNSLEKNTPEWLKYKYIDFAFKTESAALSHGMFGWEDGRVKDFEVADSITAVIRELIQEIKDTCDNINKPWIYAHTDSCFINANKDCKDKILKYLNDIIQSKYQDSDEVPVLEFKGYYPIGYIHSPARNILIPECVDIDDNDKWEITGMNFMRSEVPEYLGDIEIELYKMKIKGHTVDEMTAHLKNVIMNLKNVDTRELGLIKPLNKRIDEYGRPKLDGKIGSVPNHIKALSKAYDEYKFMVNVGEKFMILPIMTSETVGKRKIRRKRVDMAYSIDDGLPSNYVVDFENYLKSNLWGKIHTLFNTTPKELEKLILTEEVIKKL